MDATLAVLEFINKEETRQSLQIKYSISIINVKLLLLFEKLGVLYEEFVLPWTISSCRILEKMYRY